MSDALTSNALVETVKKRANIPENQSTFDKDDFLSFATEELRLGLVPIIMSLHEDHLLYEIDIPLQSNKSEYSIPSRAIGNKLRDVQFKVDSDNYREMTRIGIGQRFTDYDISNPTNLNKYYLKNNKVVLVPNVGSMASGSLTMVFYIKPSKIVQEDRVAVISGINRTTGVITLSGVPDVFTSTSKYDFYKATAPYSILNIDMTPTSINSNTNSITFSTDLIPDDLEIGDHVSLAGEAIIPQIPSELHDMLAQMVACRILEAQGDEAGLKLAIVKLQQMREAAGIIIDNRVDDAPQKIVNRHGIVRTSVHSKRFNRK